MYSVRGILSCLQYEAPSVFWLARKAKKSISVTRVAIVHIKYWEFIYPIPKPTRACQLFAFCIRLLILLISL